VTKTSGTKKGNERRARTQADRRQATRAKLLAAAQRLFGERGYADTSLEDIAEACDMTIRPIYHYYESKLGLFAAVVEEIESTMVREIEGHIEPNQSDIWSGFMASCEDPHFRQIILIDAPNLLGHRMAMDGAITKAARERAAALFGRKPDGLTMNMLMGALTNAALYIAEHGADEQDYEKIRDLIDFHSHNRTT